MDGWKKVKIGDLGEIITGKTPSTKISNYWGGTIPFITPPDLNGGSVTVTQRFITEQGLAVVNALPYGAVLTSCIGSIGRVGIVAWSPAASNQQINSLIVNEQKANNRYCLYAILYLNSELNRVAQKTTIPILNKNNFSKIQLPLPPLPEQLRIATILTAVQQAIEEQVRLIALTTELKKALMQKLFTEGTRCERQKMTEIGPVPESWSLIKLKQLFSQPPNNGLYKPKSDYGKGTLILRIDDFSNEGDVVTGASNRLKVSEDEQRRFGLAEGDIIVNRVNSLSHLGKTARIGYLKEPMLFESNMMRFRVKKERIFVDYAFFFLNSPICKKQILEYAKRAIAQSSINQGDVNNIIVPLPGLEEQKDIIEILSNTANKINFHREIQKTLIDLFRTLLHQLMTAQIRVNDVDLSELKAIGIEVD